MSIRTYKYKLYRSKRVKHLHRTIDISGIVYNHCIALHKRYYRLYGKHLNKYRLQKHLTKLKKREKHEYWGKVGSQAIQNITERIDEAYKKFFDYTKGKTKLRISPPNFKKVKKYRSFTLKGKAGYKIDGNVISINGHKYKFWLSREISGIIKTVTVKRDHIGDFYICISLETKEQLVRAATGKSVGIDFGIKTFLTLSDSLEIEAPLYHLKYLKQIKKLNRNLSKKKKGSTQRAKVRQQLAKLHIKVVDLRKEYFHQLSNTLALEYDHIFIEDLNMKSMQKLWGRKVSDLGFSEFVNILSYKTNVVKIDRFYPSTKTCNYCGELNNELKDLNIREWQCPSCGTKHQRDINAAINIHRVGASTLGIEDIRPAFAG